MNEGATYVLSFLITTRSVLFKHDLLTVARRTHHTQAHHALDRSTLTVVVHAKTFRTPDINDASPNAIRQARGAFSSSTRALSIQV